MESKQQIRTGLQEKRKLLSEEEAGQYAKQICQRLYDEVLPKSRQTVYCYYPLGREVNLLPLAEQLIKEGHIVAFPKTAGEMMEFYPVRSLKDFQKGAFGIMEPLEKEPLKEKRPFVLVPGLGFDRKGNRIGYGKGFYDRYFTRFPDCKKIGTAYSLQIVKELPAEPFDVLMDMVVTEEGMI